MPDDEDLDALENAIIENAQGPAKASDDTGSMEQHSLSEQIEADKYMRARQATRSGRGLGIKLTKLIPPGSD